MTEKNVTSRNPWTWVPTLYFAEGTPYVIVMFVSVVMYKRFGVSNTDIALYTSWLYLPWVIKPLWSPVVDILSTKRNWIIVMQIITGAGLAGVALTIHLPDYFRYTLAFFWLLAFSSATHDIAADGFYMLGLSKHDQAWFVGIRSTFYKLAMIASQGFLVMFAGYLEERTRSIHLAWTIAIIIIAVLFLLFFIYHNFILPRPSADLRRKLEPDLKLRLLTYIAFVIELLVFLPFYILLIWISPVTKIDPRFLLRKMPFSRNAFAESIIIFLIKDEIGIILAFLFLYRLGEAQLVKITAPFMLDPVSKGGLGLSTASVGFIYGTVGLIALTLGGILGGFLCARNGLKYWLWWMLVAINLPDLVYVYLSLFQTSGYFLVNIAVSVEQFGYGFGFTAFMLYLIYVSEGDHKTSHYAIATGFMALGMMIPGMFSGWLEELLGYQQFFIWVCLSTIPIFVLTKFIKIDPGFGKKKEIAENVPQL